MPKETTSLALIVEDPDALAVKSLVHTIVWAMPPDERGLAEGAIVANGTGRDDHAVLAQPAVALTKEAERGRT